MARGCRARRSGRRSRGEGGESQHHEAGQEQAQRALGQGGEAHGGAGRGHDPSLCFAEESESEEAYGQRHTGRQQHVHGSSAAVGEKEQRRGEDEPRVEACRCSEEPRAEERGHAHEAHRGDDGGQAGRHLVLAEQAVGQAREPVVERRLLEPGRPGQGRGHPFVRALHLDRHPCVARLVGAEQGHCAQAQKQQARAQSEQHRGRPGRQVWGHRRGHPTIAVSRGATST